jgi:hypothetical protein
VSMRSYRRLEAGRTMQRAVCPAMIDRDVETRVRATTSDR